MTTDPQSSNNESPSFRGFYVAGLGASAGGLEALRSFFGSMPGNSGIAFVVIQHLSPDYPSQMAELLASHTTMPVSVIEDGVPLEPNHVYVIPPGKCAETFQYKLLLSDSTKSPYPQSAIDHFFRSLAEDCREMAVGIVLSGTGSDGTLGVRAIKEAGGTVMVQQESSALFDGMPQSARMTGMADYVLPAAELGLCLFKFVRHPLVAAAGRVKLHIAENTMSKIIALIRSQSGIDFAGYKQSTVLRRIERRIGIALLRKPEDYLEYLQQSEEEVSALIRDLLINVTRFFRDSETFEVLRTEILPAILEEAASSKTLRIWVPGCATGEEAYSIAMLAQELIAARGESWELKVFATDADESSIAWAGRGIYPKTIAADVPPELLARYFVTDGEHLKIRPELRARVVFARQNILRDPPFTRLDLISCRNLLIYLQVSQQRRVIDLMHFALRSGGYLLLGMSETIGDRPDAFEALHSRVRIFKKRLGSAPAIINSLPEFAPEGYAAGGVQGALPMPGRALPEKKSKNKLWERVGARLMAEFVPTCLVLNENHEILHSFGQPQRFLALQAGRASLDIFKLAPRELSLALSSAIHRATKEKQTIRYSDVRLPGKDGSAEVMNLKVELLAGERGEAALILVFFEEPQPAPPETREIQKFDPASDSIERIIDLEEELQSTKEQLQSATEDKQAAQEELQATNEELLAGNEELQSSNEELESVNEELTTLNSEYQQKIRELTTANNDLQNVVRTSDVATIFLDATFHIRRFTPVVTREIGLQPHDIGRLLTDFAHPLIAAIAEDLQRAVTSTGPIMKTVETSPDVLHLISVTPYRREGTSDLGLVVTILDVSALGTQKNETQGDKK
ncbi:MAG: putative chemotaxis CheB/CheR fusion protein [Chthoniobacteraceae bacterium]|nr:putative chemotaxis CheB/CheR fusion protein [Chthoniobacteraceae bacterium]